MCLLHIDAQSHGRIFEVLPDEGENAELLVEDAVSHVLMDLFGEVIVDDVAVHFSPASPDGQRSCAIHIQAQCTSQSFSFYPCTKEFMELVVGQSMSSLLKEIFGPLTIKSVLVLPLFMESR